MKNFNSSIVCPLHSSVTSSTTSAPDTSVPSVQPPNWDWLIPASTNFTPITSAPVPKARLTHGHPVSPAEIIIPTGPWKR